MINVQNVLDIKKQIRQHCFLSPHIQKNSSVKSAEKSYRLNLENFKSWKLCEEAGIASDLKLHLSHRGTGVETIFNLREDKWEELRAAGGGG